MVFDYCKVGPTRALADERHDRNRSLILTRSSVELSLHLLAPQARLAADNTIPVPASGHHKSQLSQAQLHLVHLEQDLLLVAPSVKEQVVALVSQC